MRSDWNSASRMSLFRAEKFLLCLLLPLLPSCSSSETADYEPLLPDEEVRMPVPAEDEAGRLKASLPSFLNDGMTLPLAEEDVTWEVVSGRAYIDNGVIFKSEDAEEYEPVVLKAVSGSGETTAESLLLDPYAGYVISYFSEQSDEPESMKLALTFNCTYWFKLNEDRSILKAQTGTGRLRDPALVRKKDGSFAVCATMGYDTDSVYVFDSPDLVTYENERLLKVNCSSEGSEMSEKQAWAPEIMYDRYLDTYVIFWSSVADGGMFYNTSSDLVSFSPPVRFDLTDHPVIDGTIVRNDEGWFMVLKDEQEPMEEHSQLMIAYSDGLWNSWNRLSAPFTGHQSEGPMVMRDLEHDGYYIFYDDYTRFQFKAYYSKGSTFTDLHEIADSDLLIPLEKPAHSYALPLTWKEIERLMNAYGS